MEIAAAPIRIARPSLDLGAARRFWVDGLGLEVLYEAGPEAEGGHALLMVGWRAASWHLELVGDPGSHTSPGREDLLVLYLGEPVGELAARLLQHGGTRAHSPNPYWERWAFTVEDPDGYRLVLSSRTWT